MDFLSNASYSGYRNHIQKDILQENVRFEQCDWTWHVNLLSGWSYKAAPRDSIRPNWSRQPLGGVKKAEVKYPGYTSPLPLFSALQPLLTSPLGSLSLRKNELSLQLWTTPSQLDTMKRKNPLSLFTSFYSLTLVYFLSVSSCAKLCLPNTTSPRLCKTSQRPLQRLLNSKPISDFGKTLSWKDGEQRESFKHKATQVQTPDFAVTGVILM